MCSEWNPDSLLGSSYIVFYFVYTYSCCYNLLYNCAAIQADWAGDFIVKLTREHARGVGELSADDKVALLPLYAMIFRAWCIGMELP